MFERSLCQCVRTVLAVLSVFADTRLSRPAMSDCCENFAGAHSALRPLRLPQRESLFAPDRTGGCHGTAIGIGQVFLGT